MVARSQVGTVTGAMNFFRALMASFTVAAFSAILLMAMGADISLSGEHRGPVNSIPVADMVVAFRCVFAAAAALLACASLCMILMEEKPLAGPAMVPAEMGSRPEVIRAMASPDPAVLSTGVFSLQDSPI